MKDGIKKQIIDLLSKMEKATNEEKLFEINRYSEGHELDVLQNLFSNLKNAIEHEKEEIKLREIFYTYVEAIDNNKIDECLKKYNIQDEKTMSKIISKFIRLYATETEQYIYINTKSKKGVNIYNSKRKNSYKEKCMGYTYVQDVTKLLLYNGENIKVLFDYYMEKKLKPTTLRENAERYIERSQANKKEVDNIKEKVEQYFKYYYEEKRRIEQERQDERKAKKKNEELESDLIELLNDILQSNRSFRSYCEIKGINNSILRKTLNKIKRNFPEIYSDFEKQLKINEINESKNNVSLAYTINDLLKTGIEEDGTIRQFDIIDYYKLVKTSVDAFLYSVRLTLKDEKNIVNLITTLKKLDDRENRLLNKSNEYITNKTITCGENEIIIDEEVINGIVSYLNINNIPINSSTYYAMENRYIEKKKKELVKSI